MQVPDNYGVNCLMRSRIDFKVAWIIERLFTTNY